MGREHSLPIFIGDDSGVTKNDIYTWTIGDTAIEEVKGVYIINGKKVLVK